MTEHKQDGYIETCLDEDGLAEAATWLFHRLTRPGGRLERAPDTARECVQRAFEQAVLHFGDGAGSLRRPRRTVYAFIKTVADRYIVDLARRGEVRANTISIFSTDGEETLDPPDRQRTPYEAASYQDLLRHCSSFLSMRARPVFMLRADQHLEYAEIASALGVPTSTVRSILVSIRTRFHEVGLLEYIENILSE